jgi:hypothetical protein
MPAVVSPPCSKTAQCFASPAHAAIIVVVVVVIIVVVVDVVVVIDVEL